MLAHSVSGRTLVCVLLALAAARPAGAQVLFTNVANSAGVGGHSYFSLTSHGLGTACIDVNRDGWPDMFCVNGKGSPTHLYLNQGNGTFVLRDDLLPPLPDVEKPGAIFADYDNDGDDDIYVYTDNFILALTGQPEPNPQDGPPNLLLKNLWIELGATLPPAGQPLFEEVAADAGVDDLPATPFPSVTGTNYPGYRAVTASWLDYDRDGWVDLYVGHMVCANTYAESNWNRLFRNQGDGTFAETTIAAGLHGLGVAAGLRPTLAVVGGHFDQDLWPDLYVGNIACNPNEPATLHNDVYFRNTGLGAFVDATSESPGLGDDAGSAMGIAVGDVENDGDWDVYITDIFGQAFDAPPQGNPLYLANGNGTFQDNSAPTAGVAGATSWPTNFFDADDDGDEDLFMGAFGSVPSLNRFWLNDGAGSFTDVSAASGVQSPFKNAYGSAVFDYDRDGDLDLVVNNGDFSKISLLRNDSPDGNHWLGVKLEASVSNRSAIGTVVKARVGSQTMMRQVLGGSSAHSQDELVPHFGLGSATVVDSLEVFWPSGLVTHLSNVAADQYVTVTEASQHFAAFGQASPGGGTYAPSLILSGSATPGGEIAIDIASAQGGGLVFLIVGLPAAPPLNLKGCLLHLLPLVIVPAGATTAGPNGQGHYHLPAQIPVSATPVTAGLQAFVTSASLPGNESATNGVTLTILP